MYLQKDKRGGGRAGQGGVCHHNFWSIVLDNHWSKKICKGLRWSFDDRCYIHLRWSCFHITGGTTPGWQKIWFFLQWSSCKSEKARRYKWLTSTLKAISGFAQISFLPNKKEEFLSKPYFRAELEKRANASDTSVLFLVCGCWFCHTFGKLIIDRSEYLLMLLKTIG